MMSDTVNREEGLKRLTSIDVNENSAYFLHYLSFHASLKNSLDKYAQGDLLDIGCGNKPYERLISSKVKKYVGCDIVQSSSNKVDIIAPANNIPLPDNTFDTVLSTQTIEHVEDHQGLISEAYRVLKSGGHFILSGPFTWPLHEEPYDFFRFTKHGFRFLLEKHGFEIIELESNGGMWANAGQTLIHAFEATKPTNFRMRLLISIYHRLNFRKKINRVFKKMDESHFNDFNTINYVIVARKN